MVVRERTQHALGLPNPAGGACEPAEPTANGVYAALEVVLNRVFGSIEPSGLTFTVVGLGQVGSRLTARLVAAGAKVTVNVDPRKALLADDLGARWVATTGQALDEPSDLLIPAGVGGLLSSNCLGPHLQSDRRASQQPTHPARNRGRDRVSRHRLGAGLRRECRWSDLGDSRRQPRYGPGSRRGAGARHRRYDPDAARHCGQRRNNPLAAALSLARQRLN